MMCLVFEYNAAPTEVVSLPEIIHWCSEEKVRCLEIKSNLKNFKRFEKMSKIVIRL